MTLMISRSLHLCVLVILSMMIPPSSAFYYLYNFCPNTSIFESNSVYQTHLNTVFHSLSSNSANSTTGFFATSSGTASTEAVYGLFMCRGDQDKKMCLDCVTTATTELPQLYCPNSKEAIIWYEECMVRYSNESIVGKMDQSQSFSSWYTQNITGNMTQFTNALRELTNNVSYEAAKGGSLKKYATNVKRVNTLETMYALGQCTPDLSVDDCNQCLRIAIQQLPISLGAVTSLPSCNVEYEMYPFFNGATDLSLPPPQPPLTNSTGRSPVIRAFKGHRKTKVSAKFIIAIVLPVAVIALMILGTGIYFIRKKAKKYDDDIVAIAAGDDDFPSVESLQYDFGTLQSATNNFSNENKLGEGGFGGVYKGTLPDGRDIAVKRLSNHSGQGIEEFKNEVKLIAKLQHRNLVRVLGFFINQEENILVYEYVANKSLNYFVFDPERKVQLNWGMRYNILKGIARGMLYLHQDSQLKIVHRDLKASNILLDKDMNPKISDFGMARIFNFEQSESTTNRVIGTYGYMAPEYVKHGKFSTKSDVYSFGVLTLEIISGQRNNSFSGDAEDLLNFACMKWRDDNPLEFMDPIIRDSCRSIAPVMRCMQLGLLCVQESADKRPTMATIVLALESYSVTLSVPEQPTFFGMSKADLNIPTETLSSQSSKKPTSWSVSDASITELDPR